MFLRLLCLVILLSLFAESAETSIRVEVNFDRDPSGAPIPDSTVINSVYAPLGIHFAAIGPGSCTSPPDVYASLNQPAGFGSPPNVVSVCAWPQASDFDEFGKGMIEVTLDQAAISVCIDVDPPDVSEFAVLRTYDGGGGLLSETFSTPGVRMTLCTVVDGIRKIEFSGSGNFFARFDNLVFEFGDARNINFNDDTTGSPVIPGTVINNLYAPWGVTFAAVGSGALCGPDVYASDDHPLDFGTPRILVSTCEPPIKSDISEQTFKVVEASFNPPACAVCINVRPDDPGDRGFLRAYDAGGVQIGEVISSAGVTEQLCLSGLIIYSVQFSGFKDRFCRFDDLVYSSLGSTVDIPRQTRLPSRLRIESVVPNPSRGQAWVTYSLDSEKPAMIQLIDVSGRALASRWLAGGSEGFQRIEIGTDQRLPAGIYWIRLTQAGRSVSEKWVIFK